MLLLIVRAVLHQVSRRSTSDGGNLRHPFLLGAQPSDLVGRTKNKETDNGTREGERAQKK